MVSARPRRMSEVKDAPEPIIPIPEGSAFFIMSQTNRCAFMTSTILRILKDFPSIPVYLLMHPTVLL